MADPLKDIPPEDVAATVRQPQASDARFKAPFTVRAHPFSGAVVVACAIFPVLSPLSAGH